MIDKQYILMCQEATELQKKDTNQGGSFYYQEADDCVVSLCGARHCSHSIGYDIDLYVWLPTQEQLQEIGFPNYNKSPRKLSIKLADFADSDSWGCQGDSMNQLWLAFVMHELYQKRWDTSKKKWIKEI